MTGPLRSIAALSVRWLLAASAILAVESGVADARAAGYDGSWTVLIITEAGSCDQAYSFQVRIAGHRVMAGGGSANVTGSVGEGGGVAVRVSSGGSFANGTGRLRPGSGAGRWSGRGSAGVCSGRWQATRS